jgi:acetoin:2,6-dichlorophenolindophenol oxidoreductase subunit alpha
MSGQLTLPEGVDELETYRRMRVARRFDECVLALRTSNVIEGPAHPAIGQEAVAVGVRAHLRPDEKITSTHLSRDIGTSLWADS